jgi:membrane-associated progesterone receptor component
MSFSLAHPINTALLLYILYLVQRVLVPSTSNPRSAPTEFKAGYSWKPRAHAPALLFQTYTPRTLAKYSGHDNGRILLAITGTVFDVTAGRGFYGPGEQSFPHPLCSLSEKLSWLTTFRDGMYGNFAGRDASRGMAKQSFDHGTSLSLPPNALDS